MRSTVSAFYIIILEILWMFRLLYDFIVPESTLSAGAITAESNDPATSSTDQDGNERRHLIHLFTHPQKDNNKRPVCYMHVYEILSPVEQEMLRCVCAKEAVNKKRPIWNKTNKEDDDAVLPTQTISREKFTNIWMDSFSLIS